MLAWKGTVTFEVLTEWCCNCDMEVGHWEEDSIVNCRSI
jgi:hypothetical protein